jgi:hypothetical protein
MVRKCQKSIKSKMANELTSKLTVKSSRSATQDFQNRKESSASFIGLQIYELMREERANNSHTNWMRLCRADIGHAVAPASHRDAARTKVSQRCLIGDGLHCVTAKHHDDLAKYDTTGDKMEVQRFSTLTTHKRSPTPGIKQHRWWACFVIIGGWIGILFVLAALFSAKALIAIVQLFQALTGR